MNVAYSEELRPPKELFSRLWFHTWNTAGKWEQRIATNRIDKTKKKLEDLEIKLRIKRRGDNNPGYFQDLLVDTVTLLNSYIGVWEATKLHTPSNISPITPPITMVYPHTSRVMSTWEEIVLGGVQREGVCLCMLSPEAVEWLNRLYHWVGE